MDLEFLLVKAEVKGVPEKVLLKSRNIGQVDLIWPRTGVAKKSGAREMVFKRGVCDFTAEPWTKRVVFHDEASNLWGAFARVHRLARKDIDVHFVPIGDRWSPTVSGRDKSIPVGL